MAVLLDLRPLRPRRGHDPNPWARSRGLSFVTPLAYDYRMAWAAIRSYYAVADEIVLGLDRDRVSWNGKPFAFDEGDFRRGLAEADPEGKVTLVEGDFHSQATPLANDTHERNVLSLRCRPGHWVVQIDSDERLLNGPEFRAWLLGRRWPWRVMGRWIVVFKRFGDDYLVAENDGAWISVANRVRGSHTGCREHPGWRRRSPLRLLHFSMGRDEADLREKLAHWSHARDFDTAAYLELWKSVTVDNHRDFRDVHPLNGPEWPSLRLVRRGDPDWVAEA